MQLQDLLITEQATVKEAIEQLERVRCKVVYVVKDKKLLASVSDGDAGIFCELGILSAVFPRLHIIRPVRSVNMKEKHGRNCFREQRCILCQL